MEVVCLFLTMFNVGIGWAFSKLVSHIEKFMLSTRKRDVYKGCPVTFQHLPNPYEYICKVKEPWDNFKK